MNRIRLASYLVAVSLSLSLSPSTARATDGSWAVDADGIWSTAGNWLGGSVATGASATAYFTNAVSGHRVVTVDYAGPLTIGHLSFDGGAANWSLTGGSISLSAGGVASRLAVESSTATIASPMAGGAGVVKVGAGTLTLAGTNSYSGATVVSNGVLQLTPPPGTAPAGYVAHYSFDDVAGTVVNNDGSGGATYNGNLSGATITGSGHSGNAMAVSISSTQAMTIATAIPLSSGKWTVSAWFSGLYTSGSGNGWSALFQCSNQSDWPIIEQQSNTHLGSYSGGLGDSGYAMSAVVSGWHQVTAVGSNGVVRFFVDGAYVGQTSKNITSLLATVGNARNSGYTQPWAQKIDDVFVYTNAISDLQVTQLFFGASGRFVLPPATPVSIASVALLDLHGVYQAIGSLSDIGGSGGFVVNSGVNSVVLTTGGDDSSTTFSGIIAGTIGLSKAGAGTFTLSGPNSFEGGLAINAGTVSVGSDANLGATGGNISLNGGTLQVTGSFQNGAGIRLISVPTASAIDVASGQTYVLSNAFLSGSSGALSKKGSGTLVIGQSGSANNLTGVITIDGGTVIAQSSVGDGAIRNNVVVNNGGTLWLASANAIINSCVITVNAGGVFNMSGSGGETIAFYAGAGTVTNQNTGMTLSLGNVTNDFSGSIGGTGNLLINNGNGGAGVQILSGTNTLSGAISVQGGTLSVSQNENLGAPGAKLNILGGTLRITGTTFTNFDTRAVNWTNFTGTLDLANAGNTFVVTNEIAGTGTVTKVGAGALVLQASNTCSGAISITGGTLDIAPSGALSSVLVTVGASAQLILESANALTVGATLGVLSSGGFGKVVLSNGTAVTIAQFKINGALQASGTWGATGSGAAHIDDTIFSGPGVLNVLTGFGAVADGSWVQDASGHWGELMNWLGAVIANGTNSTAYFTNTITGDRIVNNGYASLDIGNLFFSAATNNWSITNNALNLAVLAGTPTITVVSKQATIVSALSGNQGLLKTGGGTLVLSGSNTFNGGTAVGSGALNVQNNSALGAGTTATVASGSRMELQKDVTIAGVTNVLMGDGGNTFGALQAAGGVNTWAGKLVIGNSSTRIGVGGATGGTLVVNGGITDGGSNFPLTIKGQSDANSTVILGGINSYGGNTEFFGARLQLAGNDPLNTAGSLSNRALAATFDLGGFNQTLNGIGVPNDGGRLTITNSSSSTASTLTISNSTAASLYGGVIAATVTVVKTGSGKQSFGPLNTFPAAPLQVLAGNVIASGTVFNGAVTLASGAILTASDGPGLVGEYYQLGGGVNYANLSTPQLFAAHLATTSNSLLHNFPVNGGTTFDFANNGSNFPQPFNSGAVNIEARWRGKFNAPTAGSYYFDLGSDDGSLLWIDGDLVVNNNTGHGIVVSNGTVNLTSGSHDIEVFFGQGTGGYGLFADVAVPGGSTNRISNSLVSTGPGVTSLSGPAGSSIVLNNATLSIAQPDDTTFGGSISGVGEIRKLGQGTLTLTGSNSQTNSILAAGRLAVSSDANLGGGVKFDGGLLRINGTTLGNIDTHTANWSSFIGGFDIADASHTFAVTNDIVVPAPISSLWKYGPGTLSMVGNTVTTPGILPVQDGTLMLTGGAYVSEQGGFAVGSATVIVNNASFTNGANVFDNVGNVAGDNGTMLLQTNSRIYKGNSWLAAGNSVGSTGTIVFSDNAYFTNAIAGLVVGQSGVGTATVKDDALLRFSGNNILVGNNAGSRGTLYFQDNAVYSNTAGGMYVGNNGTGVMFQTGGTINMTGVGAIGSGSGSVGAYYQSGGDIYTSSEFDPGYGNANAYGFYEMSGGSLTNRSWIQFPRTGLGLIYQTGGSITPLVNGIVNNNGTGVIYQTGGLISGPQPIYLGWTAGKRGELTLAGGTIAISNSIRVSQAGNGVSFINLNSGTLQANNIYKYAAGGWNVVNFNGALVRAGANNVTFMGAGAGGVGAVDAAYVGAGGMNFDTQTNYVSITQPLLAPPGSGVSSITITNGGSGYLGAPYVQVTGGSGTGATVVAQLDVLAGTVTNIVITSPGVSYATTPVLTFGGGGGKGAGAVVNSLAANASGGLTKYGSGSLTLAATNTYGGITTIADGTILVGSTNSIPGLITILTNTSTVGATYPIDQAFINWLTSRLSGGVSPGIIVIGTNTASALDFSGLPNTSLGAAGGTWTYSGTHTLAGTNLYLGNAPGVLVYAPQIGTGTNVFIGYNGDITFAPVGAVQLSGSNAAYAGTIDVVSGTLRGGATNSLGGSGAQIIVEDGATLDVNGQNLGSVPVYVKGTGVDSNGAIVNNLIDQSYALQTIHLTGDATFGSTRRWDLRTGGVTGLLDLSGYKLTKIGGNIIGMVNATVTDGDLDINEGMFRIESGGNATSGVGRITINPAGSLDFWTLNGVVTRSVTMNGGTMTVGSGTANIGSLITLDGPTNSFAPAGGATLAPTNTIDGAGVLLKTGAGTMKLAQNSQYTGQTIVGAGTLELASSDPLNGTLSASSNLLVTGGRVLVDFDNGIFGTNQYPIKLTGGALTTADGVYCNIANPFEMAGGGLAGGVPSATNGSWVLNTNIPVTAIGSTISASRTQLAVPGGVRFEIDAGASLTVGGTLEDPGLDASQTGTVIKAGAGLMEMTATNSYSGATVIEAGTLKLSAPGPAAGAALWLDASDLSTLVSTNGSTVNQWTDKSGNGRNATQNATASQPASIMNGLVNRQVMNFAGGQVMDMDLSFMINSEYSIFAVEGRTNNGNRYFLGSANGSANNGLHFGYRNDTQFTLAQFNNDINAGVPTYTSQSFQIWDGILDFGTGHALYRDGTSIATSGNTTSFTASMGAGRVGSGYSTQYFQGDLAEILIYDRALDATARQAVETYLRNRWVLGLDTASTNILPTSTEVRIAAGATLDLAGIQQEVGSLSGYNGGSGNITNSANAASMISFGSDNASTNFDGTINNGTGTIGLVKLGTGTQTLNGVSSCSGDSYISNGTLIVNGAIAPGTLFVDFGGTLGGTGVIGGLVFQFGTVAPGSSSGILTILGSYAQAGELVIEIDGTAPGSGYDRVVVGDTASLQGPLTVTTNGYAPVAGDAFTILTASNGLNGGFASTNLPPLSSPELGWKVDYQSNAIVLSVTSAPTATGYDLAALTITNGLTGYQDDADGDGYANLLEYVTGGNLTNADTIARMQGTRIGGLLALQFTRASNSVDTILVVEGANASTNNANWIGIATNLGGSWGSATNVVETNGPSLFNVTAFDSSPATNRFLRLRVTRP